MRKALLAVALLGVVWLGLANGSVNDLPGFSDATGPQTMSVESFERLDSGCVDEVADYSSSRSGPDGQFAYVSTIETERADADLRVWTERTSPPGADLSSFRVHVESASRGPANDTCQTGIQYRLVLNTSDRGDAGFLPDESGVRILRLENGEYAGCTGGYTGGLDGRCQYPMDRPEYVWANATR